MGLNKELQHEAFRIWMTRHLPLDLFRYFGMLEASGSEKYIQAVEHNVFVAAAAETLGRQLVGNGIEVNLPSLIRAAIVHDVSKRRDLEQNISREAEARDNTLALALTRFGYTKLETEAAKNTTRLPDRYIEDPKTRMQAIANHSIEANIVGYVDARVPGSRIVGLDESLEQYVAVKSMDEQFFRRYWHPYYQAVEAYFQEIAPDFDPNNLTDDAIFETIRQSNQGTLDLIKARVGGRRISAQLFTFSEAKAGRQSPHKNEDIFAYNDHSFILADGSTSKANAQKIDGQSGGRITTHLVTQAFLATEANGRELVDYVTDTLRTFYAENVPKALSDLKFTFATTLVAARVVGGDRGPQLVITQVGDTAFRINGEETYIERRKIDEIDAANRAIEIERLLRKAMPEKHAISSGRKHIESSLNEQHKLWNNPSDPLGFGYVNGHHVPDQFIHTYTFPLSKVQTLELFSDGYPVPAHKPTIKSWEEAYKSVEHSDPYRYKEFPATKPKDDRTIAIMQFLR